MNIELGWRFIERLICFGDCSIKDFKSGGVVMVNALLKYVLGQWMELVKLKVRIVITNLPHPHFAALCQICNFLIFFFFTINKGLSLTHIPDANLLEQKKCIIFFQLMYKHFSILSTEPSIKS